jgi:aminoglycoside phosphotransferase (APT) family kinase protein
VPPVNVWDAEHALDADQARQLLAAQFPQLALDSVQPLGIGFDNTVFLVDGAWAFRFPRREVALPLMQRELGLLPGLAPRLPLAVPVPELLGQPGGGYPWPFWGARLVPGRELADAGLPEDDRVALGAQVGGFLAALHQPAVARDLGGHLPHDPMRRGTPSTRGPMARDLLDRLAGRGSWQPGSATDRAVDEVIAAADPLGQPDGEPVLVHGDLHLRHLLVGPDGLATGVIDWGDSCLADPALDLSLAFGAFSGPARAALRAAYGRPLDKERELRARVLALALCAALADYGDLEGHAALRAEALAGVARAVT